MRGRRVLIVDDYPDAASVMGSLLSLFGLECHPAKTGREAIAIARSVVLDIALIDIGLPDMPGYDVAREIRAIAGDRRVFLAAVTGASETDARERARAAGFDHHVQKPIDRALAARIVALAEQVLAHAPASPAVIRPAADIRPRSR